MGCVLFMVSACGKDEPETPTKTTIVTLEEDFEEPENVSTKAHQQPTGELPLTGSAFINDLQGDPEKFLAAFNQLDEARQYYFCTAFAMGAMSVVKPITATAMVNYFMGLGAAKYRIGITDATYDAFNAGKNVFLHENLVNTILEEKICEDVMDKAATYAKDNKLDPAELDKRGKFEVEKVIEYITKNK